MTRASPNHFQATSRGEKKSRQKRSCRKSLAGNGELENEVTEEDCRFAFLLFTFPNLSFTFNILECNIFIYLIKVDVFINLVDILIVNH